MELFKKHELPYLKGKAKSIKYDSRKNADLFDGMLIVCLPTEEAEWVADPDEVNKNGIESRDWYFYEHTFFLNRQNT